MKIHNIHEYQDIIDFPYEKSQKHTPMPQMDRAAQFAPFAALTGHKEAVCESGRNVEAKRILDENKKAMIDEVLQRVHLNIKQKPVIKVIHFIKDELKEGGSYITTIQKIRRIDEIEHTLIFVDKRNISIDDIYEVEQLDGNDA